MKHTRALWVATTVLALALTGCIADETESGTSDTVEQVEQEPDVVADELLASYRSPSDQFEVSHPVTWVVEETFDGGAVVLANTQEAMDRYRDGAAPDDDDLVVNVGFLPATLFEQRELRRFEVTEDLAPDDYLRAALPVFETVDGASVGEVELVMLPDGSEAGAVSVEAADREGRILAVEASPRVTAIISTTTAPGKRHGYDEVVESIAASSAFDGDDGALYGRLLTG